MVVWAHTRRSLLLCVALLLAVLLVVAGQVDTGEHAKVALARGAKARADVQCLADAMLLLRQRRADAARLEDLMDEPALLEDLPRDPWGRDYVLRVTGPRARQFVVVSAGPDGVLDTADDVVARSGR